MRPYLPLERRQYIIQKLEKDSSVRISELSRSLMVSEMTIRRDLDIMEAEGILARTHGGAVLIGDILTKNYRYQNQLNKNVDEKKRIAEKAASFIEKYDVCFITEGTTTALVLMYADKNMPFTVYTTNLGILSHVRDMACDVILLGGVYKDHSYSMGGAVTMEAVSNIKAHKMFIGADGMDPEKGITILDHDIAAINRSMMRNTVDEVFILSDHSKFKTSNEQTASHIVTSFLKNHIIITDKSTPEEVLKDYTSNGGEYIIV